MVLLIEPHMYAVFGSPITHSRSPEVHRSFATATQQDLIYTKQEVKPEEFREVCDEFFQLGGSGLNITLPLKELAYEYADELTERAQQAGAVNTLKLLDTEKVLGDNTDGAGLVRDILHNLRWPLQSQRVLILGAGGAVRGVLGPILAEKPYSVCIANRTATKAVALAEEFSHCGNVHGCGLEAMPQDIFDVIINGTSMSLQGEVPPVTRAQLTAQSRAYDMAYGAEPTPFMEWARQQGLRDVADGLGMLVEQAAESFYLWRGVRPPTADVIQMLRESL